MEATPPTKPDGSKTTSGYWHFINWAFALLLLYLLSTGPVVMFIEKGKASEAVFGNVYLPVVWLYNSTFFHKPLGMYWHLWAPRIFDGQGDVAPIL